MFKEPLLSPVSIPEYSVQNVQQEKEVSVKSKLKKRKVSTQGSERIIREKLRKFDEGYYE